MSDDLFSTPPIKADYTAKQIEVLEGLEPVRRRPGMYVGGTGQTSLHHLATEILDNAMDEAVAGHAGRIQISLENDNILSICDNGRGIPVDTYPDTDKSALEVILTTLHAGGKFSDAAYKTSGGLHGVGASVVNALSSHMEVEVARDGKLYKQIFAKGQPITALEYIKSVPNRRGTLIRFTPDEEIFGQDSQFNASILYQMAKEKAYLYAGIEIRWQCVQTEIDKHPTVPAKAILCYPGGLSEYLQEKTTNKNLMLSEPFADVIDYDGQKFEWALTWLADGEDGFFLSYCNMIPTPLGGEHEKGFKNAIMRGMRRYGEIAGHKKASELTTDDIMAGTAGMVSVFLHDPQFQGQTKDKLVTPEANKQTDSAVKDRFEIWLSAKPERAQDLLDKAIERLEERKRRRKEKEISRKSATRKLRLPGKLADCSETDIQHTELFLVEGDSAGGSAKSARNRKTQAVLPLRGKILNVASATNEKVLQNQELSDLALALGVKGGKDFQLEHLRYGKIIIMTDADVDGAHIATLLMTYFYRVMPQLIEHGRLYLAQPPLYRMTQGKSIAYALDDEHKETLLKTSFDARAKVDISRFKGLGEMPPAQLKETTMHVDTRRLIRVGLPARDREGAEMRRNTDKLVNILMGKKPELRFAYIQDNAHKVAEKLDV